mgnify:CR=1 FL=1|jgi:hypothetical protein|tara:strand:+ start:4859 stop:5680 length:822 start_codon:yes stop_codon:yes gene_type:complete
MSLIQSGKIFNDGEQLTAGKLNQIISDATLSTTGVDGSTIVVNENDVLAVRTGGIGSSSLANDSVITNKLPNSTVTAVDGTPDGVTLPKLQHIETDKILGRTTTGNGVVEAVALNTDDLMASASATTLATDGSIKAYVNSMRPKFVALTGGTTDLTKKNQADGTTVTYNIADFTSSDSDFATSKITGLIVEGYVFAKTNTNLITASLPATGLSTVIARCYTNDGTVAISDSASTLIPINSDTSTFSFGYVVGNTAGGTYNQSVIRGAIIQPGL